MSSYVKRRWTVENTWTCDSCGEVNRGRDMKCKKCGSYKEKHEKYDTSKNLSSPAVTDPELLKLAKAGPNWSCDWCKNDVRNVYGECSVCGGPKTREASQRILLLSSQDVALNDALDLGRPAPIVEKEVAAATDPVDDLFPDKEDDYRKILSDNREPLKFAGMIFLGLMGLIGFISFCVWLFGDTDRHVVVTSTDWQHVAHLEQRHTLHGTGWQDDEPASHFNDICETRQHGTHDCNPYNCNPHSVSYECNCHSVSSGESCHESCSSSGNGFSECTETCTPNYTTECDSCSRTEYDTCYEQCPTMEQWCSYDYYHWNEIAHSQTYGHNNHNLTDPTDLVAQNNTIGPQRITIDRTYHVIFTDYHDRDDDTHLHPTYTYTPDSTQDFNRFSYGDRWFIQTNRAGSVKPINLERTAVATN